MTIYHSLKECPYIENDKVFVIIGNFDGVHLGHQSILKKISQKKGYKVVITFSNHPQNILHPEKELKLITVNEHKLHLISQYNIDVILNLPFNKSLANLEYHQFLNLIRTKIKFTHLMVGYNSHIGKECRGDFNTLSSLSKKQNFHIEQLHTVFKENTTISSSAIRALIQSGEIACATKLLGRQYSIRSHITSISMNTDKAYLVSIETKDLLLPKGGSYAISYTKDNSVYHGIGIITDNSLEAHFKENIKFTIGQKIEIYIIKLLHS